ncbi:hypothetical protein DL769_000030 [Monosporascus sp. CRB-8-3]|nr:hypothetical protein DL769_000030 [Monosporascus sp. CRB-8-3]
MSVSDIAIVGLSFDLPQKVRDEDSFWHILQAQKNLMTEWPNSRINIEAFHSNSLEHENKLYSRGAHFLDGDPAAFDAPFFAITAKEAMAMDPQQRHLLEASYHAFENAGITIKDLKGSRTAVFEASMSDDYSRMQAKDPDSIPQMAGTVIRSTGTNQDGRTPGLTQPSAEAQEALIREVYSKAGLDLARTRYIEAHGTGTAIGDPIEVKAIRNVFGVVRTPQQPLYVGSVKSNIGHLEGCSGLASIVKSVMILEKGVIPPTALVQQINPAVAQESDVIQIPVENMCWPTQGLRRVSVNSFGFGGSNAHVILDDTYHYLLAHNLPVNFLMRESTLGAGNNMYDHSGRGRKTLNDGISRPVDESVPEFPELQLLVWTAPGEKALGRVIQAYQTYHASKVRQDTNNSSRIRRLAYTLGARRSHMTWRAFTVLSTGLATLSDGLHTSRLYRTSADVQIGFIFTGQGAQYVSMGYQLIQYPIFKDTLERVDNAYRSLGCTWSVIDNLRNCENINRPEYSQPLCTALQLALVELLSSFGVLPQVVIGHSSGEIAAAYASGALSLTSACKVSYIRGQLAGKLKATVASDTPGAMISVNLPASEVGSYLDRLDLPAARTAVHIACYNSPFNCTLSGPEELIDALEISLKTDRIFAQKLSTGVAYHSPAMEAIASDYLTLLCSLEPGERKALGTPDMISTVTGEVVSSCRLREPQYWVDNLVSAVRFSDAMQTLLKRRLDLNTQPIVDHGKLNEAGMVVMALEAVKQTSLKQNQILGFYIQQADFTSPLVVGESFMDRTETMVHLAPLKRPYEKEVSWFQVKIHAYSKEEWRECCHAIIQIQYHEESQLDKGWSETQRMANSRSAQELEYCTPMCTIPVDRDEFYEYWATHGIRYGSAFKLLRDIKWDGASFANAKLDVPLAEYSTTSIVHPAVLDSALQVLLTQASKGLSSPTNTCVPHQLSNSWISETGWKQAKASTLQVSTRATERPGKKGLQGTLQVVADDGSLLCDFHKIMVASIANDDPEACADQKLLYNIEWKPQLSMLDANQLGQAFRQTPPSGGSEESMRSFRLQLNYALGKVVRKVYKALSHENWHQLPQALQRYTQWMKHCIEQSPTTEASEEVINGNIEEELQEIEGLIDTWRPEWKLVSTVAKNLKSVLNGEIDPIRLIFDAHLAKTFYDNVFQSLTGSRLRHLLELISHENPCLRIIEVGAGTGAWTELVLSVFRGLETSTGKCSFSHYMYTDVSPAFFEKARETLASDSFRMEFKVLDLEKDVAEQGFELHGYDLVLAGSVFHATSNLAKTVQNVRQLLKPRGILLAAELTQPSDIVLNMVFGLLPGWWTFDDKWRNHFPTIDEQQWHELLKETGFSGVELVFKDYEDRDCHFSSVMLSRTQGKMPNVPACEIVLFLNAESIHQIELATELERALSGSTTYRITKISLDHAQVLRLGNDDIVISLIELDEPLFNVLSSNVFHAVKQLIRNTRNLLWVTSASKNQPSYPFYNLMKGLFRCMRVEAIEKRIVQLEVESCSVSSCLCFASIFKVFIEAFGSRCPEAEYRVENGMITTGRLIEEVSLDDEMKGFAYPQMRSEPWIGGRPLKLVLGTPGDFNTLHFIEDTAYEDKLGSDKIEIQTKEWGLNFKDIFVALGRLDDDELGCECAGVVTRVGDSCGSDVQPGDRVCFISSGCFRTYIQTPVMTVTKIPDRISLETAVSVLCPGVTAYHSLVNVARLCKGEKILIHSGAGATGQMAIQIAQMIGAEIFTTVGYSDKKKLLIESFGLAEDHIFYSRTIAFSTGIKRITQGYGVDVVLNSLSGDALRASWDCVAPYGRFIEIGKADIMANTTIPMANFQKNVSYCAVDIDHIIKTKRTLASNLQQEVINLVANGTLQPPTPLHRFSVGEIESAFRYFQSGRNTGRTIIRPTESALVPDALFENMSHEKWELTIRSKAHTSWNLHQLLPNLDFFIQLSSLAGIVGPAAQSNYAAGCTFQDALARHRTAIGQKAVSLDLGWMVDVGIIAENKAYQRYRHDVDDMQKVKAADLLAVLEIYCDPSLPILQPDKSQLLIGVMTPAHRLSRGLAPTPATEQPLYLGFAQAYGSPVHSAVKQGTSFATLFRKAKTVEERAEVVIRALASRLARALSISVENVEANGSFSDYGVDSLMAVELRNWIDKDFQANVAVFDIMGGTSITNIGQIVASRSNIGVVE